LSSGGSRYGPSRQSVSKRRAVISHIARSARTPRGAPGWVFLLVWPAPARRRCWSTLASGFHQFKSRPPPVAWRFRFGRYGFPDVGRSAPVHAPCPVRVEQIPWLTAVVPHGQPLRRSRHGTVLPLPGVRWKGVRGLEEHGRAREIRVLGKEGRIQRSKTFGFMLPKTFANPEPDGTAAAKAAPES